ncbi:MAG: 2'-5' RNA ligase family protein [Anaerolineae bacterium]
MADDYRIFVGAFPTGDLAERIQAVRERLDPATARITPPHVTLAGTYWRRGPATPENEAASIARLGPVEDVAPFALDLGVVESFLPRTRVIYLAVAITPGLLAARAALLRVLGRDKHREFHPHLTLTMRLNEGRTDQALDELRRTAWHTQRHHALIDHLWLMQRGPDDRAWRFIHRIELAGKSREEAV